MRTLLISLTVALGMGCGAETELGTQQLAGRYLNGRYLNGRYLNGRYLNGIYLNGQTLDGSSVRSFTLDGSQLVAHRSNGREVRDLTGTTLSATGSDGVALKLRVNGISRHPTMSDVYLYDLSIQDGTAWQPLCVDTDGVDGPAIALAGAWDAREGVPGGGSYSNPSGAITLACRGYALAKCVELLGYRPWAGNGPQHRSCVRVLRADYCGDGRSWTENGNPVNVYDSVGIQSDAALWLPEAEWTEDGARCLTKERYTQLDLLNQQGLLGVGGLPACLLAKVSLTCGVLGWQLRAKLVSEVPLTLSIDVL